MRGKPVLSSHLSPGFAPQVGQRIDRTFFSLTFITAYCTGYSERNWSILTSDERTDGPGRVGSHFVVGSRNLVKK